MATASQVSPYRPPAPFAIEPATLRTARRERRCGFSVSRPSRATGWFQAWVAYFDDPILLCETGSLDRHHCLGDDALPSVRTPAPPSHVLRIRRPDMR